MAECLSAAGDLGDDVLGGGFPHEGLGVAVPVLRPGSDRLGQIGDAGPPRPSGQLSLWLTEVGQVHHLDAQLTSEETPLRGITGDTPADNELDSADTSPSAAGPSARLAFAVALVRRDDTVSGPDVADAFTQRGCPRLDRPGFSGERVVPCRRLPGRWSFQRSSRLRVRRVGCRRSGHVGASCCTSRPTRGWRARPRRVRSKGRVAR